MKFDPSKHNTKPITSPGPKPGVVFDPKKAKQQQAEKLEAEKHEVLVASDPTKLKVPTSFGPVKAWSFSALEEYEKCPYKTYLSKVEKIKVEQPKDSPLVRGSRIHDLAEEFVRGKIDMAPELKNFEQQFEQLRTRFENQPFPMEMEEDWGFNIHWTPTGWTAPDVWARQKLDVFYFEGETNAVIIDHKTGRKFGNELKHGGQGLQYAIGAFMKYPQLDYITSEFWYLDTKGEKLRKNFTRERALIHLPKIHQRAVVMTTATQFPPKPSKGNCKWCDYRKSGDCEFAVEDF